MIELVGLPASGKTTAFKDLRRALEAGGLSVRQLSKVFDTPYPKSSAPRYVREQSDREMLLRHLEFRRSYPELSALVDQRLSGPKNAVQHYLFWLMASSFQAYDVRRAPGSVLMLDEGFVHRATAMYCDDNDVAGLGRYLELMPRPSVIVSVDVAPEIAYRRAVERRSGIEMAKIVSKHGRLDAYVRRHQMIATALEILAASGTKIIRASTKSITSFDVPAVVRAILDVPAISDHKLLAS